MQQPAPGNTVGLIGLGLVGQALAGRLLAHGHAVAGYDVSPAACDAARELGATVLDCPRAVARAARLVLLSLPDSDVVETVLWGPDGIAEACTPGSIILDTTTGRPEDAVANHDRLAERHSAYVDVTLVGSSQQIAAGEAIALVGAASPMPEYAHALDILVRRAFYFGGPGQGSRAKLIINLVLGLNRLVLAEGLALAAKTGLNPQAVLDALQDSPARSAVMETKGPRMLKRDFDPVARLAQHAKDVRLILDLARQSGARTPLSQLHAQLLQEAVDAGWGPLDNSAVINLYTRNDE